MDISITLEEAYDKIRKGNKKPDKLDRKAKLSHKKTRDLDKEMEMRREVQDQKEESKKTGADQYDESCLATDNDKIALLYEYRTPLRGYDSWLENPYQDAYAQDEEYTEQNSEKKRQEELHNILYGALEDHIDNSNPKSEENMRLAQALGIPEDQYLKLFTLHTTSSKDKPYYFMDESKLIELTTPEHVINVLNTFPHVYKGQEKIAKIQELLQQAPDESFEESFIGTDSDKLAILYEDVTLSKIGQKKVLAPEEGNAVGKADLSDFIFAQSNGGTENFTLWTIRENDSKTDPTKKAGDEMVINGKLKIPEKAISGAGSAMGNAQERYQTYDTITIYVTNLDGEDYVKKYPDPKRRIRSCKVNKIFKLRIGGETYNIV